jgi:hypothetical protein
MSEQDSGFLTDAARALGSAAGKVAKAVGAKPPAEDLYRAEYVGSGTFIVKKPKRSKVKLHQSRVKSRRRGARK